MEVQELRILLEVAETGSMTAAAERLSLPKSTVSRKLKQLEDRLGARLLDRTTRRLRLTESGTELLKRARYILAELDEAESMLSESGARLLGTLTVSAPQNFFTHLAQPALTEFIESYPDLQLNLISHSHGSHTLAENVDIAIEVGPLPDSSWIAQPIGSGEVAYFASPTYFARFGHPASLEDLRHHRLIDLSHLRGREDVWRFQREEGSYTQFFHQVVAKVDSVEIALRLALSSIGIALIPLFIAKPYQLNGQLERLVVCHACETMEIHALYPSRRHTPAKITKFIQCLKKHSSRLLSQK